MEKTEKRSKQTLFVSCASYPFGQFLDSAETIVRYFHSMLTTSQIFLLNCLKVFSKMKKKKKSTSFSPCGGVWNDGPHRQCSVMRRWNLGLYAPVFILRWDNSSCRITKSLDGIDSRENRKEKEENWDAYRIYFQEFCCKAEKRRVVGVRGDKQWESSRDELC